MEALEIPAMRFAFFERVDLVVEYRAVDDHAREVIRHDLNYCRASRGAHVAVPPVIFGVWKIRLQGPHSGSPSTTDTGGAALHKPHMTGTWSRRARYSASEKMFLEFGRLRIALIPCGPFQLSLAARTSLCRPKTRICLDRSPRLPAQTCEVAAWANQYLAASVLTVASLNHDAIGNQPVLLSLPHLPVEAVVRGVGMWVALAKLRRRLVIILEFVVPRVLCLPHL